MGGRIGYVDFFLKTFFYVFTKTLTFQMKDYHYGNVMESCIPLWFMLQKTSKIFLINCFQNLQHFLVEWLNIHGILSLFHISKHNLALGLNTQNMTMSFMVPVLYPNYDCTSLLSFKFRSIFGVFYNLAIQFTFLQSSVLWNLCAIT